MFDAIFTQASYTVQMNYCALLALLIACVPAVNCYGNLSGPWHGGQLLVDVEGVKDIAIVREKLRIDLRPLENKNPIRITATYLIEHTLSPRDLPLTFITGAESVQSVQCSVNGKPLPFTKKQVVDMPKSWKPPAQTPGFVPDETLLYSRSITDTQHEWILFTVPLQTGRQSIEVSYEVEAGAYYAEYYTAKFWQTAYILAPARTWKGFGGLDLEVLAPKGWQVRCNLPLMNQGEQWTASFDSLPADYVALTTQHPSGKRAWVFSLTHMFYFFGIMILSVGLKHAKERYRQTKQSPTSDDHPRCKTHYAGLLILLSFLPLAWNFLYVCFGYPDVPSTQTNYQLPVIFVGLHGVHWFIVVSILIIISMPVMRLFCKVGARLGKKSHEKYASSTPV